MTQVIQAVRYHDICAGHRVVGHESKCRHLHGHNYRVHFYCEAERLDKVGRVIDFSAINEHLCQWLEVEWDHKFLAWRKDPIIQAIYEMNNGNQLDPDEASALGASIVWLDFNPTAENMADYLLNVISPKQLQGTGIVVTKVVIEETRKCSVTASL